MIWKDTCHPGYSVSDCGLVIGRQGRVLRAAPGAQGYRRVSVYSGSSSSLRVIKVATLVCEAFHGPRPSPSHVVRHRNGNPSDDRADNLCWGTQADNYQDMKDHGTLVISKGESNGQSKLSEDLVRAIREQFAHGLSRHYLATIYGLNWSTVNAIVKRETWREVA